MALSNSTGSFFDTTEILSSTSPPRTYEIIEDEPIGVSIGIFIGILSGSLVFILLVVGLCILSHFFYMKFLKKPWAEKTSKSVWFIEPEKKEVKKEKPNLKPYPNFDQKSISSSSSISIKKNETENKNDVLKQPDVPIQPNQNVNLAFVDSNHDLLKEKTHTNQDIQNNSNNKPYNFKISQV